MAVRISLQLTTLNDNALKLVIVRVLARAVEFLYVISAIIADFSNRRELSLGLRAEPKKIEIIDMSSIYTSQVKKPLHSFAQVKITVSEQYRELSQTWRSK